MKQALCIVMLAMFLRTPPVLCADIDYVEPDPVVAARNLTDADARTRHQTAEAIAQHPKIARALIANLCTAFHIEKEQTVRAWLVNAIKYSCIHDEKVEAVLVKALKDENTYCALYAVDCCIGYKIHLDECSKKLKEFSTSRDAYVRDYAARLIKLLPAKENPK